MRCTPPPCPVETPVSRFPPPPLVFLCTSCWGCSRLLCKKNGLPNVPRKKVRISIGNIDFFAYSILKNIEILWDQGRVQSEPN